MSTRGCLVVLEEDKCKTAYIHYGGDFASELVYGSISRFEIEDILNWNIKNDSLIEITDTETITELHKYNTDIITEHDASVYIFIKYADSGFVDVVIKQLCGVYPPLNYKDPNSLANMIRYPEPNHYFIKND